MATSVAKMTRAELKKMIESTVEEKLSEMLGDPDDGLELRKALRTRLLRQMKAVDAGERGEPFDDVVRELGPG